MSRPKHRADDGVLWFLARLFWYLALAAVAFVIWIGIETTWGQGEPELQPQTVVNVPISTPTPTAPKPVPKPTAERTEEPFEYATCQDASKAKALPLRKGEPGYSRSLDTDRDGRACENYE